MSRSLHGWETWQHGDLDLKLQNKGTLSCPSLLTRHPTTNGVSLKSAQKEAWQESAGAGGVARSHGSSGTCEHSWQLRHSPSFGCTMWDHTINHSRDSSILLMNPVLYQMNWMECSSKSHFSLFGRPRVRGSDAQSFQTKRCCFKECCCTLFDVPFGNGHFAISTQCIPARNLFELAWPLGPQRLLKE